MTQYLNVENEPTVELDGYLDGAGRLQISHASGNLVDNGDALQASDPGATIRIKLTDFSDGSSTWTLNASHGASSPINWSRGTDHAYYDFSEDMSNFLEVTVSASDGSANKEKVIEIKTKPESSLPDRY